MIQAKKPAGRKPIAPELRKKMVPAYLNDLNKSKIVKKYGSITTALEKVILPLCK